MITEYTLYELNLQYHIVFKLAFHWQKNILITIDATPNRLPQSPKLFKTGTFFNQIFDVFFIYLDLSSLGGTVNVGLYTSPIEG